MTPLIEIICDGGRHGLGHLRRSSALAHTLAQRGQRVRVTPASEEARPLLPPSPNEPGEPSLWVLDLPEGADEKISESQASKRPCVALDYFGDKNPTLTVSVFERSDPPPSGRRFAGFRYAIVREDFQNKAPAGKGVIVSIGGSDQNGEGPEIAKTLLAAGESVTLIEGPSVKNPYMPPEGALHLKNPTDLPARMAACDWAVTNGGVTMTEMICLGKAVHAVAQTPEEKRLADHLWENGALLGVGKETLSIPSQEKKETVSRKARTIIDGKGLERIADLIEELL